MPLIAETDGVKAKITASVGSVEASVNAEAKSVKAGVSGRLVPTSQYVPLRLGNFAETDGFLRGGMTYVDDGKKSFRLSLKSIKDMNTKIVTVDKIGDADFGKLTVGDYIYIKKD